jgi:hypothetical protein
MENIVWKYVTPIVSSSAVTDFESEFTCVLPQDYKDMVDTINGGMPIPSTFDTDKTKERAVKEFLSFNDDDLESITFYNKSADIENRDDYIIFAVDNFGNLIAFNKSDSKVVFVDFEEQGNVEKVADSFTDFLDKLY